jgi:hypothetical protein
MCPGERRREHEPGIPAPAPRSAMTSALRTSATSSPASASATWTERPRSGSCTVVGASSLANCRAGP